MNLDLYNDGFFKWHIDYVHDISIAVGEAFSKQYNFESIVDYGCGIGSYLQGCYEMGVAIKGYEISDHAKRHTHEAIQPFIEYKDILTLKPERYDVCMCIEVAEHIDPEDSERLVDLLTKTSDFIVFSAAPPGQSGTGHINCRSHQYWIELFKARGFKLTRRFLESWIDAPDYVLKNLMIYEQT